MYDGLVTLRSPLRGSETRIEEKFYGSRGDALIDGLNTEISQSLTIKRRPGNSVFNNQIWQSPDSLSEFREFNSNTEQIKVMVSQSGGSDAGFFDGTGPDTKIQIWKKNKNAGQTFSIPVGNELYFSDGANQKKWDCTLTTRIPYVFADFALGTTFNPYNFTPFELNTFIIDTNGNVEQLIGTVLQLLNFYILDNTIVFSLKSNISGFSQPLAGSVLVPGLQIFFPQGSQIGTLLSAPSTGVTLTVLQIVGNVFDAEVDNGGSGYTVGDAIDIVQTSQTGSFGADGSVTTVGTSGGSGYVTASNLNTTTNNSGVNAVIDIVATGALVSGSVVTGGTGYVTGDKLFPVQIGGVGGYFLVTATSGVITSISVATGVVTSFTRGAEGSGYLTADNVSTTGGTGTGLTLNIEDTQTEFSCAVVYGGGPVTSGTVDAGGTGYAVNDLVFPTESSQPLSTGASFKVTSVSGSVITGIVLVSGGTGYASATGLPTTTSGSGTGATISISVAVPSSFPLTTATDVPDVFSGGIPISDSRPDSAVPWATNIGGNTIDGSALWVNRGAAIDGGIVWNWGLAGGTTTPSIDVEGAISEWAANTYYNQWQIIVDSNGNIQQLITGGLSGPSSPSWSTSIGGTTSDNKVKWVCLQLAPLSWAASTMYSPGHVVEETVSSIPCLFQLQADSGIQYQGTSFPIYLWQCASQSGADIGSAGEWAPGGVNQPMVFPQALSTATFSGTTQGLWLHSIGGGTLDIQNIPTEGDGTLGSPLTLFSANENFNVGLFPNLVIPVAGTYTFTIGHQNMFFWGIGNGTITLEITSVEIAAGVLTIGTTQDLTNTLSGGVSLTFSGVTNATFLNGTSTTVSTVSGKTFSSLISHADYAQKSDTGEAASNAGLTPALISATTSVPVSGASGMWKTGSYDFSSGTPVKGYPVMSSSFNTDGAHSTVDTVQVNFPSAGVYPVEGQFGYWFHSMDTAPTVTVSPVASVGSPNFWMVYSPPGSFINYQIIPQALAESGTVAPVWPAWTTAGAPLYPTVVDTSGNQTWWNIGPVADFQWHASVNYSTQTFIIDINSNKELPFEAGVSGTVLPTFSTLLFGLTFDLPNLVWMNDGTVGNTPEGTVSTFNGGWSYVVALVNTLDDTVSNASPPSLGTGNFFSATGVFISGGLPSVIDPQADYVAIFRTQDGGATYFLIPPPASGNGNTEYTLPLSQYLADGFIDTTPDTGLNFLLQAPILQQNTPPKTGIINGCYFLSRIFVSLGNTIYWSTGPDTPIGNGVNGFSPSNFATFPSLVKRMVPLNAGLVVFTVSDIYVSEGNGTPGNPITFVPYLTKIGLLSYNALTVNGSVIYLMTTDNQVVELSLHAGVSQIGQPIANLLQEFSPRNCYLTWHVNGFNDQCLFVGDGDADWYRFLPSVAPETGVAWCPKATITQGAKCIQSIETSPGNIQLLIGPSESGPILFRDYNTYADDGTPYWAFATFGNIVLANPGQLAEIEFITTDSVRVGSPISIGVLLGEISGEFEDLTFWTQDPPMLPPSLTLYSQRFYISQTKMPAVCRHFQLLLDMGVEDAATEILSISPYGSFLNES